MLNHVYIIPHKGELIDTLGNENIKMNGAIKNAAADDD